MNIALLLQTKKTVFTVPQIGQILGVQQLASLRNQLTRRKEQGILQHLQYGVWALPHYSAYELANTLKTPSYISLETILVAHGVVFQRYGNIIFSISDNTKSFHIQETTYRYQRITPNILLDPEGITYENGVHIASVERAICDRLYLTPGYYFDNLRNINRTTVFALAQRYQNKRLLLDLTQLRHDAKHTDA